jgi:hypothetical protein
LEIPILETFYNVFHFLWEEEGGSIISAKLEGARRSPEEAFINA